MLLLLLLLLLLSEISPKWKLANSPCNVFFGEFLKGPSVLVFQYYLCFLTISRWMQSRGTQKPLLKFGCTNYPVPLKCLTNNLRRKLRHKIWHFKYVNKELSLVEYLASNCYQSLMSAALILISVAFIYVASNYKNLSHSRMYIKCLFSVNSFFLSN